MASCTKDKSAHACDEKPSDECIERVDEGSEMQREGGFKEGEKGSRVCNSSRRGAEANRRRKDGRHPVQERKQEDVCSVSRKREIGHCTSQVRLHINGRQESPERKRPTDMNFDAPTQSA